MINYNHLLAVYDSERDNQPAVSRAIEIRDKTDAQITVIQVIYDFSYEMTTMLSNDEREAMRLAVIEERTDILNQEMAELGKDINGIVVWHNRPFEAITLCAVEMDCDLVVKATKPHDGLASVIFTPTDWHLLRKCPTPLLLVKEHGWPNDGRIVAAVSVGTEDREHTQLNEKISVVAKDYAEMLSGHVHFANAFPSAQASIAIEVPDFDPTAYNEAVRNHHLEEMEHHANKHSVSLDNCHVMEGLPEKVIPELATKLDAELVVIGTVGRFGLSAALIGNTAEHVIDELNCDVLAIKPDGFKSPVI